MQEKKLEFAQEIVRIVQDLCHLVFNMNDPEQRQTLFGISDQQIDEILTKIATALPDELFQRISKKKLEELKTICAREFIFFQVQERNCEVDYATNLDNFMRILIRDVSKRF